MGSACFILLFIVSLLEVITGYYLMLHTILDMKKINRCYKGLLIVSSLFITTLLTANRRLCFFSRTMFLVQVVLFCIVVFIIRRKGYLFIFSYVWLYHGVLTLLDFVIAFFSMTLLGEKFYPRVFWNAVSLEQILIFALSRIILIGLVILIIKYKWKINEEYTGYFVLIDVILSLVILRYQKKLVEMAIGEISMNGLDGGFSLLGVLVIATIIVLFFLKNRLMAKDQKILELHDNILEQRYQSLLESTENSWRAVHDIRHHLLGLRMMVQKGEWQRIEDYLNELDQEYLEVKGAVWTGNYFLDFILTQKKQKAEEKGIRFAIEAEMVTIGGLTEAEQSILFGNLIDHAIENCEETDGQDNWIRVEIKKRMDMTLIKISNSVVKRPIFSQKRLISGATISSAQGYGMKSVERIVDRHDGELVQKTLEDRHCVMVSFYDNM